MAVIPGIGCQLANEVRAELTVLEAWNTDVQRATAKPGSLRPSMPVKVAELGENAGVATPAERSRGNRLNVSVPINANVALLDPI